MFGFGKPTPGVPVGEVQDGLKDGSVVLIDVRDPMEIKMAGKAEGAIEVPLTTLQMRADPRSPECDPALKDTGTRKVVYCASGARSAGAIQMLRQMGHAQVENLGGLHDWVAGGGALVRG